MTTRAPAVLKMGEGEGLPKVVFNPFGLFFCPFLYEVHRLLDKNLHVSHIFFSTKFSSIILALERIG